MPKGSVKIMLSHDYCHFEICLGSDDDMTLEQIDDMRKDAQRLADKAVEQYKIAKKARDKIVWSKEEIDRLTQEVKIIKENYPKSEWTPQQQAVIKTFDDLQYQITRAYDYQDDWDDDWDWGEDN